MVKATSQWGGPKHIICDSWMFLVPRVICCERFRATFKVALKDLQVVKGITLPLARPAPGTLTCIALALTQRDREHDERT
jgi:hypothetical protein